MRVVRNMLIGLVALLAVLIGAGAWMLHRADHDPRYADVVGIASDPAYQDAVLLERAWALPVAVLYGRDSYEYQGNPSFCGPASAANVARSLGRADANQRDVLRGTNVKSFLGFVPGVTLDQEADILRAATDLPVEVLRDLDLETFRAHLRRSNETSVRYVANFHRGALWGEGHGHISPILGYLPDEDLVLVGDVNESFGPFLVKSERLLAAMNTTDSTTGKSRGLALVGSAEAG